MTLLIASVFVDSVAEADAAATKAVLAGADAVELRVDSFAEPTEALNRYLEKNQDRVWLVTCRTRAEGGRFEGDCVDAANLALAMVHGTNAWVDTEFAAWKQEKTIQDEMLRHLEGHSTTRVILSHHAAVSHNEPHSDLINHGLAAHPRAIAKVAYQARHINDSFAAIDLMHQFGEQVIAIAMGEPGSWTRLLARKLGAFATFAAIDRRTGDGQWSLEELRQNFQWDRIHRQTRLYGVAGDPIAHSASPELFNHWFATHNVDGLYLPLRIGSDQEGLAEFLNECRSRPWLDLAGLSITIPHKEAACRWAGSAADPMSREIGAANCLVLGTSSHAAYNTDSYAAVDSLAAALGGRRSDLGGTTVDVLGCGGSARAVCHGLSEMGCQINVYARDPQKAGDFKRWKVRVRDWSERLPGLGEVLINCTPVGMWPASADSPIPPEGVWKRKLVFDLIYRPLKTRMLADAEAAGVPILDGLDMFVRQAATQLALWIGLHPEISAATTWLKQRLEAELMAPRRSIALIGARGSGKTTVAALVARIMGLPHLDTDAMIVAEAGKTIREIFDSEGETGFRRRETRAIRVALEGGPAVISLGGGGLLDEQNRQMAGINARVYWLTATIEMLAGRLHDDPQSAEKRPPLIDGAPGFVDELKQVLPTREPIYREAADVVIETDRLDASAVAQMIVDEFARHHRK